MSEKKPQRHNRYSYAPEPDTVAALERFLRVLDREEAITRAKESGNG